MFNAINFAPLYEFIVKIFVFFERPSVQIQLLALISAILLAWLLSKGIGSLVKGLVFPTPLKPYGQRGLILIEYLNFPVLSLIALTLAGKLLLAQDWLVGLLSKVTTLFWVLLVYRFFVGSLYAAFSKSFVRRYHYRLFAPLFILYIIAELLAYLTNLEPLRNLVLTTVFESAITAGTLFQAIVGLYLWVGVLWGAQDVLYRLITKQTTAEPGVVEAILTLTRYILIGFGIVVVITHLGFNPTTVAAITGGLSVGIGFSLRDDYLLALALAYKRLSATSSAGFCSYLKGL